MKKTILCISLILFSVLIFSLFHINVQAKLLSKNQIYGEINQNMRIESINQDEKMLFVPTNEGMYLMDDKTFEIKNFIPLEGTISHYEIIDNIEGDKNPNKDLLIFLDDDTNPSVILYSLDSFNIIWTYTTYTNGYNQDNINIDEKTAIFDYDYNDSNLLLVSGYKLYNLDIKTGHLLWDYHYSNNIWSVSLINDINSDAIKDIAISVQPSKVITLDGKTGKQIWGKTYAKAYTVEKNDKKIGSVKRNIWDIKYVNKNILLTGEDGYLYQVNPLNGNIIHEKQILTKIPNILAYQIYLDGNSVKDFSGLGAYKLMQTRVVLDTNNDHINDFLVTVYESNPYANFTGLTPSLYLIDGKTLDIIWEKELTNNQLTNLHVDETGVVSYYTGKDIAFFNLTNNSEISEVSVKDIDNSQSLYPLIINNTLLINHNGLQEIDISDVNHPTIIDTISSYNGYDTIIKDNRIYKLYFTYLPDNKNIKNYQTIECFNTSNKQLYSYDLGDNYFNQYTINDNTLYFVSNLNKLYTLNYTDKLTSASYDLTKYGEIDNLNKRVVVLTMTPDFNGDGKNDLLINYDDGEVLILNSENYDDAIIHNYINSLLPKQNDNYTHMFPLFIEGKKEMYAVSNNKVLIVSFDDQLTPTIKKEIPLDKYNYWDDGQNTQQKNDFDFDGYNDYVIQLNNNQSNKALILYTGEESIGSITTGWDYSLYPSNLTNSDGRHEVIVSTTIMDNEENNQNIGQIVTPSNDINTDDIQFNKVFKDGNDITYNSQYKTLAVVDDMTGDGKKNIAVLVDRWGDSYIQIYNLNDDKTVQKIIPLNVNFTSNEEMIDQNIGAPSGFIDTFTYQNKVYMIYTISKDSQNNYVTQIVELDGQKMKLIGNINGRIHNYQLIGNTIYYQQVINKNEKNYTFHSIDLSKKLTIENQGLTKVYNKPYIDLNWQLNSDYTYYNIYLDGKLVSETANNQSHIFLKNGINQIGIGGVTKNGVETITNINLNVKLNHTNRNYLIIYTSIVFLFIILIPLKRHKYKRKGA